MLTDASLMCRTADRSIASEEKDVQRVTENDETRDVHTRVLEAS